MAPKAKKMIGRLMLIDDDQADQFHYQREIARAGLAREVVSYLSPQEGLAALQNTATRPDLVLLDIHTAGMDGFDFLEEAHARAAPGSLPVIVVMTSAPEPEAAARAAGYAAVAAVIGKPLTQARLRQLAETYGS